MKTRFQKIISCFIITFFSLIFCLILAEVVSSFFVPKWPARILRPVSFGSWGNSWGLNDTEHDFKKKDQINRVLFVGDSFLEGGFVDNPLHKEVSLALPKTINENIELINLGVSATGPMHYYYRIKNLIEKLEPDAIFLFFYSGNDWINRDFQRRKKIRFKAELPLPSILGSIMPRLNWLLINRSGKSETGKGDRIKDEISLLKQYVHLPHNERMDNLAKHVHKYYLPGSELNYIHSVLNKGDLNFWNNLEAMQNRNQDAEFLQGWILNNMVCCNARDFKPATDLSSAFDHVNISTINATISWLDAIRDLCEQKNVKLHVFLIPTAVHDKSVRDFWSFWPKYLHNAGVVSDAQHAVLSQKLASKNFPFIDLYHILKEENDIHRVTDLHWNTKGHQVVGQYIAKVTEHLMKNQWNSNNLEHYSTAPRDVCEQFK